MEIAQPPLPPSSSSTAGAELQLSGETQESVFACLRAYCVELLGLLASPRREAPFLSDMAEFLRRAPPGLLQPCLDYTLLPLLLLLDAAIGSRSQQTLKSEGTLDPGNPLLKRHKISDSVAEGALRCLEELLRKCHLTSVDQMAMVLKKLSLGASLSPSEAAEEFREGIIKCVKSILLLLEPCSSESCKCKQAATAACMSASVLQDHVTAASNYCSDSEECLLGFLQSSSAFAAVGHWLSLLLQAAETEAQRGLRGSAKLRKEAFLTLRVLIAKLCRHPSEKVRQGVVDSTREILVNCCITLKKSKLMLLECLCVLVCDDSEAVCVDAQEALESLFMLREKYFMETELAEMLNKLIEMLPRVVIGSEETSAVAHAQKLLALMYYAGPSFVVNHLLHPPILTCCSYHCYLCVYPMYHVLSDLSPARAAVGHTHVQWWRPLC